VLRWPSLPGRREDAGSAAAVAEQLAGLLAPHRPGECEVLVRVQRPDARCIVPLGREWSVRCTPALMDSLEALVGHDGLQVIYDVPAGPESAPLARR
jgi:hypothetical protein